MARAITIFLLIVLICVKTEMTTQQSLVRRLKQRLLEESEGTTVNKTESKDTIINVNAPFILKFCMRCQQIFRNPTEPVWSKPPPPTAPYFQLP